jgi:hypothetical protein
MFASSFLFFLYFIFATFLIVETWKLDAGDYLYSEVTAFVFSILQSDGRCNQLIVVGDLNGCRVKGSATRILEEV